MNITTAYLITNPDDSMKAKLRLVGATWSLPVKGYFVTAEQKQRLDSGDIPQPTLPSGIVIEDMMAEWKISGDTFSKKDIIKSLGGRWNAGSKAWVIPRQKADKEEIMAALA